VLNKYTEKISDSAFKFVSGNDDVLVTSEQTRMRIIDTIEQMIFNCSNNYG